MKRMLLFNRILLASLSAVAAAASSFAATPDKPTLEVYPQRVQLQTASDEQALVVRLVEPSGITRDLTDQATYTAADGKIIKLRKNAIFPVAEGKTTVTISAADQTLQVPVEVKQAAQARPVSF